MTIGVRADGSNGQAGFVLALHDFSMEQKCVIIGAGKVAVFCPFTSEQKAFSQPELGDPDRDSAVQHQIQRGGIAAR